MTSLRAQARASYASDVADVAGGLAKATDVAAFTDALRELLELATDYAALVSDRGDGLAVKTAGGELLISVQ